MNQPTRIAVAGVRVTSWFVGAGLILIGMGEGVHWAAMWWQARSE